MNNRWVNPPIPATSGADFAKKVGESLDESDVRFVEECVVAGMGRKVVNDPYVLHLWRPVGVDVPRPPKESV